MSTFPHHPLHNVSHEVHHLLTLEQEGESGATPLIAIAAIAMVVFPLLFLVIGLDYGIAHLVTGAFL